MTRSPVADQLDAAASETRALHDQIGAALPVLQPDRAWFQRIDDAPSDDVRAYILAAMLDCTTVCVHIRRGGPQPAFVQLPPGSGPRHLLFSADGKHAWLTMEMSAQVAVFDYHDGTLEQTQMVDLAAGQPVSDKAAAALHASADGKFLYVSNRGTANQLLVFGIDPVTARLTELQRRAVEGDHPREFSLDPSSNFVLIANQKSNQIVVVERDAKSGLLGQTVQKLPMDAPSDLKFLLRQ